MAGLPPPSSAHSTPAKPASFVPKPSVLTSASPAVFSASSAIPKAFVSPSLVPRIQSVDSITKKLPVPPRESLSIPARPVSALPSFERSKSTPIADLSRVRLSDSLKSRVEWAP